jgi:hypothetical protein
MSEPFAGERFSRHVTGTRFEDLSADAIFQAKTFILDTLGVGIAGSSAVDAGELQRISVRWGAGSEALNTPGPASVPVDPFPTSGFLSRGGTFWRCGKFECPLVVREEAVRPLANSARAQRSAGNNNTD